MKVLITETQADIIKLRRNYGAIQDEFTERTFRYNPCDFDNYEGGIDDYFTDVVAFTVDVVLGKLFNVYDDDDDNERFLNLSEQLKHMLFVSEYESFTREIQEYLFEHCRDTDDQE